MEENQEAKLMFKLRIILIQISIAGLSLPLPSPSRPYLVLLEAAGDWTTNRYGEFGWLSRARRERQFRPP